MRAGLGHGGLYALPVSICTAVTKVTTVSGEPNGVFVWVSTVLD
jgi:hypothetical protein